MVIIIYIYLHLTYILILLQTDFQIKEYKATQQTSKKNTKFTL